MVVTVVSVRQQLANLAHSGGSHKDQADKYVINDFLVISGFDKVNFRSRYRAILDAIITSSGDELADTLKVFIEASKFLYVSKIICLPFN